MSTDIAIRTEQIVKHFGEVRALGGVDLEVEKGKVLGLLGPNGSGKTTLVRVLTTLTLPDSGKAFVEGHDVVHEPALVRQLIGLAGQFSAIDDHLTGFENLEMTGRLYHLDRRVARARAEEMLETLHLADAADRPARTYSGGMKRRLDLAASLVAHPDVLFLDEPTTGLDPQSRLDLWSVIRELVASGTTLLLTTQYLEEADSLADSIVVIDHGHVIARGTSAQLKDHVGGDVLRTRVHDLAKLKDAALALAPLGTAPPSLEEATGELRMTVRGIGATVLLDAVRALDAADVVVEDLALQRPSLDDVFLSLTGHAAEDQGLAPGRTKRRREHSAPAEASR